MSYATRLTRMLEGLVNSGTDSEEEKEYDYFELMHNHYGSSLPQVFAEDFQGELEEQGLGREADILINHFDEGEKWVWAWENVLSKFVYDGEYYLHSTNDALYAVKIGTYPPDDLI